MTGLAVHGDSRLGIEERRPRVHLGDVFHDSATAASLGLVGSVWRLLEDAFPGLDPRLAQHAMSGEEHFERTQRVRHALLADEGVQRLAIGVLSAWGWSLEETYVDRLRLRAVPSGAHRHAAARAAYVIHRDTWYANPPAQVNLWLAVRDVSLEESFAFYPAYWGRPIGNSSAGFDHDAWTRLGGWQVPNDEKSYPGVTEEVLGPRVRIPCAEGESLLFSGSHLHGPVGHDSGRTRFSLELRTVNVRDLLRPQGFRNVDSRATGSTLPDFRRASDGAPFPSPLP